MKEQYHTVFKNILNPYLAIYDNSSLLSHLARHFGSLYCK